MIVIERRDAARDLERKLLVTAKQLGSARGQMLRRSRLSEGSGWRHAPFLWPLIERS